MTASSEPDTPNRGQDPSDIRRILVTGASGFIGSHIVEALCASGFVVRALVRRSSSLQFLNANPELAYADITDAAGLGAALSGVQAVIHCAGLTKARSFEDYRRVNRDGTERLLAGCGAQRPAPRVVCLSSLAAFGPSREDRPVREEDDPHPVSDYGRSKLEAHRISESFMKDLPLSILVPPAVYGPRDRDILTYFRIARMGFLPSIGRRDQYISFAYVKDVARAAVACMVREEAAGRSYFVEDGEIHTWRSIADAIGGAMHRRLARLVLPRPVAWGIAALADCSSAITGKPPLLGRQKMRELIQGSWTCSGDRIRRELCFNSEYPLDRGVQETYRWYVANGWL